MVRAMSGQTNNFEILENLSLANEIIVDNFAGGGGASTGIELAIGRSVDIAINHDPDAITMHRINHPYTEHYCESVWDVDPRKAVNGRKVALCWLSPDCKHFSKAKGGKPVEKKIRGLAWVAIRWAATVRPRVIILENVEEFKTWGPLLKDGKPDPDKKGRTFQAFVNALKRQGYQVEWKELRACDYGAPTIRKRFFLIARCDGAAIVWPKPTHAHPESIEVKSGKLECWRSAAEIINWSLPCSSIFARKKSLAENTMRRVARGIDKFVINNPEPFILSIGQTGFTKDRNKSIHEPLNTIVTKAEACLIAPTLIQYHTETTNSGVRGQLIDKPIMTLDSSPRYALTVANLCVFRNHMDGKSLEDPLPTITTSAGHFAEQLAFLTKYYGQGVGQKVNTPMDTIVSKDRFGIVSIKITKVDSASNLGHWDKIRTLLNKYCDYSLAIDEILLLCIKGVNYFIGDIGLRMLEPRELFNANGFPENYIISKNHEGKTYSKSAQVARCGNAVPPPFAQHLVMANLHDLCKQIVRKECDAM